MNNDTDSTQGEEMVAKLIAAAGKGPTASAEARQRIYDTVRARWEEQIAGPTDRRERASPGRRETISSHRRAWRWNPRVLAMAATLGAIAISLALIQNVDPGSAAGQAVASLARVQGQAEILRGDDRFPLDSQVQDFGVADRLSTASDGRVALRFDDGLSLRMNGDTELRFTAADEVELVRGMVYVDSGSLAATNALRIQTPFGMVEHLGTQYQVDLGSSGLELRVREGQVSVRLDGVEEIGTAGEQLDIQANGNTVRSAIAANDSAWDWVIDLATLPPAASYAVDETLAWIARERGLTLAFATRSTELRLGLETLSGLEGLDPVAALAVVARTNGLSAAIEGDTLVISDAG